ncbi:MAG: preprotein translocase subunit SecA [Candidatus Acidulodesulfobacterium acidiphilum]|uniref:Protein translocase subunit SecA n=1 Tax=Candidatus Acidulodesulfobacterium acidiphilum TaxID=2597224 RepID=A0A520X9C3_9DELT|nr:MAG: preprotein translocase subunit SecA [Candidatus Acidulodesulfobacterium acidiphilum]
MKILKSIFGTSNQREIARLKPLVEKINSLEPQYSGIGDDEIKNITLKFKDELKDIAPSEQDKKLDEILPLAFAVAREGIKRALGLRAFDVQLIGASVLHSGKIAEMATGEGKTLVAVMPAYLNSLTGRGVHIITVNDYLAKRDAEWMGKAYNLLGLSVGVITNDMDDEARKKAYNCDVTYGTNNEFGFDYLRDNMKYSLEDYVQRELNYAIIDEVDSVLIDEARTPLIISGESEETTELYYKADNAVSKLVKDEDFTVDEKLKTAIMTEEGIEKVENALKIKNIYDPRHLDLLHAVNQSLRAHACYFKDVDYLIQDNQVVIVDEFTGRVMNGRRYGEGLHQALEAKEHLKVEGENQTLATVTFQNFFRMYNKLAGMTGTADTEAEEFKKIYNLDVVVIPTNKPMARKDHADLVYATEAEKFNAVADEIAEKYKTGQPVLVGTVSVEKSERLSGILKKKGIPHSVLNAKNNAKEAQIIANAGQKKSVTISTNMAGRGTDIVLGDGVKDIGGLHVIGTERHESRRIDNQLRGRSGRQGDVGSSRFYVSLEDDLMRIFGSERLAPFLEKLGLKDGQAIEHGMISKAIENAQKKVEGHNFDIRKNLIDYDNVMNKQRELIYSYRKRMLEICDISEIKEDIAFDVEALLESYFETYVPEKTHSENWDIEGLLEILKVSLSADILSLETLNLNAGLNINAEYASQEDKKNAVINLFKKMPRSEFFNSLTDLIKKNIDAKIESFPEDQKLDILKALYLQAVDSLWKDALTSLDVLKEGIGLRGYAQVNPLIEYQKEAYSLFINMQFRMKEEALNSIIAVQFEDGINAEDIIEGAGLLSDNIILTHNEMNQGQEEKQKPIVKPKKIGRNEPCPCGSGKKYKNCHGKNE